MQSLMIRQNLYQILTIFLLISILPGFSLLQVPQSEVAAQDSSDLSGVRVAVYTGGHSTENLASRTALIQMLDWMNAEISLLSPDHMLNGSLEGHSMLVMPGISPYTLRDEMGVVAYDIIRDFIARGGAFIGIYGGTFFEWSYFGLFDVELQYTLPDLPAGKNLVTITIHKNETGPDLNDLPDSYATLSWTGSYFDAPDMSHVTTVASYALNGLPCMVTFRYGLGVVFLSSPHPEIEEGDSRDETTFQDGLNDPDSEWGLMRVIARWLIDVSGIVPTNPIPGIVISAIVIVVTVIVIGVIVVKRREEIE
jgi:glutamine amidotransferase-like uncharacterized protein